MQYEDLLEMLRAFAQKMPEDGQALAYLYKCRELVNRYDEFLEAKREGDQDAMNVIEHVLESIVND